MELRRPSYFALASLIDGPLHGYAMMRRAAELSGGDVQLSTGTLYALLERALAEGLVVTGEPYTEGGRRRRDYALTADGRRALEAEAERLEAAARTVTRRLRATTRAAAAMSRERVVGLALRAYPSDVRADLGAEMASTALDAGAGAREIAGLVRAGLAHARDASGRGDWSPMASVSPPSG